MIEESDLICSQRMASTCVKSAGSIASNLASQLWVLLQSVSVSCRKLGISNAIIARTTNLNTLWIPLEGVGFAWGGLTNC
jgi:hypothetical protein